jgi:hypothetical protein
MMVTRRIVVSAMLVLLSAAAAAAQPAPAASDKADALSEAARKGDAVPAISAASIIIRGLKDVIAIKQQP